MSRHPHFKPCALVVALAAAFSSVQAAPNGGQVVSGSAVISQPAANLLQVNASTGKTIINWQQFSIAKGESVQMNLPSASSAILNRVTGGDPSQILGSLQSNGRVFLINPNGVVFGAGASIDTAGFIASTLGMSDADFLADRLRFSGSGGDISNQANMVVKGNLALIAPSLTNNGTIRVENGNLLLAAGQTVELVDLATPELRYQLSAPDNAVLNLGTLDVVNGAASLFAGNIRHAGQLQATRAELGDGGKIVLRADNITVDAGATINADAKAQGNGGNIELIAKQTAAVHGSLSARGGSKFGDGGFIETSGKQVQLDGINVDTRAGSGKTGNWLIDPTDFVVAASGGDITGAALSAQLQNSNITLKSVQGQSAGNGDIKINDAVSWSADTVLGLEALRHVEINQLVQGTGSNAGLNITVPGSLSIEGNGRVALPGSASQLVINGNAYQMLRTQADLSLLTNGTGNYALADNIVISPASYVTGTGTFSGTLRGMGNAIDGLDNPLLQNNDGTIRDLSLTNVRIGDATNFTYSSACNSSCGALAISNGSSGVIENVLAAGSVYGPNNMGGLVAYNDGSIRWSEFSGNVGSTYFAAGGLVGSNSGQIGNSSAAGSVQAAGDVGGLVGRNYGNISSSSASSHVTGTGSFTGGLVGSNNAYNSTIVVSIIDSVATGQVDGGNEVGGLVGSHQANNGGQAIIRNSQATGDVTGNGIVGGLVGTAISDSNSTVLISGSYVQSTVTGAGNVGGLVGNLASNNVTLRDSYALGKVIGNADIGGAVGSIYGGLIANVYASVTVIGITGAGGLVGYRGAGAVTNSFWNKDTSGLNTSAAGAGLTSQQMTVAANFAGWDFSPGGSWRLQAGSSLPYLAWQSGPTTIISPVTPPTTPPTTPPISAVVAMAQSDIWLEDYQQLARLASGVAVDHQIGALGVPEDGESRTALEICP